MKILVFKNNTSNFLIGSHTIIVLSSVDIVRFKKYCKNKFYKPYKVFVVNNVNDEKLELFAYYLKYKYFKYHKFSFSSKLLLQWEKIISFYNCSKYKEALNFLNEIESIPLLLNIEPIKLNLAKFIKNVYLPFFDNGVFNKKNIHILANNDEWLNYDFNYFSSLRYLKFNDYKWNIFNNYISDLYSLNSLFISDGLKNKLFLLSLYFYKMAIYFFKNDNYTLSYTLLHRSLDVFYQYKCRDNRLLILSSQGYLQYNPIPTEQKERMVVLLNSEKCLNRNSISTPSFFDIKIFNNRRNKLYLTHGVYNIKKQELLKVIKNVKNCIIGIDGNNWNNQLKKIKPKHKLKSLDLFLYEPSFETYLKDISDDFIL